MNFPTSFTAENLCQSYH